MEKWSEFIVSVCIICLIFTSSSYILTDTIGKEEALTSTRYGFVYEAIDHIDDDNTLSVVGIGSSMMEQAFDGNCMKNNTGDDIAFYNLGMAASRSYTDMMMIPRLASSTVDVVMIEVGVNLLFQMDFEKEQLRENPDYYVEMRLRIGTMMQEEQDKGDWIDIVLPEHRKWLDLNAIQRAEDLQDYTRVGIENHLRSSVSNVYDIGLTANKIPSPDSDEYDDYLQTPRSSTAPSKIDSMTKEELDQYNESLESGSSYRPLANGTANFNHLNDVLAQDKPLVMFDKIARIVKCSKVIIDDFKAAFEATSLLLKNNRKQIVFISTINDLNVGVLRRNGYDNAIFKQSSLELKPKHLFISKEDDYQSIIKSFLQENPSVDAILAADNITGTIAVNIARSLNYNIPKELSIIGFADELVSNLSVPRLTYINQNAETIGKNALRAMVENINNKDSKIEFSTLKVPVEIIHKETT